MIDYVKLDVSNALNNLKSSDCLEWFIPTNLESGEFKSRQAAKYRNLEFVIRSTYGELSGSIHKYYNDGEHNWNDFSFQELSSTIIELCGRFGLNPYLTRIKNLEFGVNLVVPFSPRSILKKQLVNYKGIAKSKNQTLKGKGYYVEFELDQYIVKIYDKGLQYECDENILRIEVKTRKMAHIRDTGIQDLSDLLDLAKLGKLPSYLVKAVSGLIIYDKPGLSILSPEESRVFKDGISQNHWENLKPDPKDFTDGSFNADYRILYKAYQRWKKRFATILEKYQLTKTRSILLQQAEEKCSALLQSDVQTEKRISSFLGQFSQNTESENRVKFTTSSKIHLMAKMGENHCLFERGFRPNSYQPKEPKEGNGIESDTFGECESIERKVVHEVINEYYGGIFTVPEIMSEYTKNQLMQECFNKSSIRLTEQEFIKIVKEVFPYNQEVPF